VSDSKYNPQQFWANHFKDNGESIWKPAIDAANLHEDIKQKNWK
jgi:hypothetical protein